MRDNFFTFFNTKPGDTGRMDGFESCQYNFPDMA